MRAVLYLPGQAPCSLDPEGFSLKFNSDTTPIVAQALGCRTAQVEFLDTDQRTFSAWCVADEGGQPSVEPAVEAMQVLRRISPMPECYRTLAELGAEVDEDEDDERPPLCGPVLIVFASRFACANCGEQWEKHPATVVACPDCKEKAGAVCRRPSGHEVPGGDVHVSREQAAVDAGLLPRCPVVVHDTPAVPLRPAAAATPPRYTQGDLFRAAA
ncbi:hypothetical protein [Hymenobacter jeollabukensis]|uniref:Uncharacterized protein n=1 Tax=Hymenobacter jeollabukensis TaxID=2025313 RepID=A0A5R8WJR3_9BACT|nr:hypothetical protein [Hymenobacter jeollabukensis]TLM88712.1 hypothetical protein FDY95_23030 [Hymenobacter jeollabukensis]